MKQLTSADKQVYYALMNIIGSQLTERQKCYIIMYYMKELPMKEIAARCGVSVSTVSRTIKRGIRRLDRVSGAARILGSSLENVSS